MRLSSDTGIISPHIVIKVSRPRVFSVTVFPPVFGPVTTSVSKEFPISISIGTTLFLSISGCLALRNMVEPSFEIIGFTAFIE